ncbi:MAG: SHOCT domain-containing protein [Planctomycetota bacterium]|jgi:putative membrane protein|nr:SHOCT domain-containing protein [Planctomycetota bacterium]
MLIGLIFLFAAIYGVFCLSDLKRRRGDRRDSLDILRRRLAAGEITPEEFTTLKQYL